VPGAYDTAAWGINTAGEIVGVCSGGERYPRPLQDGGPGHSDLPRHQPVQRLVSSS
jgi:hypothetical protein